MNSVAQKNFVITHELSRTSRFFAEAFVVDICPQAMDHILNKSLRLCCRCFSHVSRIRINSKHIIKSLTPVSHRAVRRLHHVPSQGSQSVIQRNILRTRQVSLRRFASQNDEPERKGRAPMPFWGRLLLVSGIGGAVFYTFWSAEHEKELESEEIRYQEFDKIHLGGDWTLTDHNGKKRSSTDFRGQWIVMYMGFTHCPDICPEEMEKLGIIVQNFDKDPQLPNLQPVFISLDPERDTPSVIKDYLSEFKSPRIVGFTGTEDEIREVAKKFRAYFGKGPKDADNDYIVDHTIIVYLINPKGEFVNYYGRSLTAEQVTMSITKHIQKYEELEKRHR